MAATLSNVRIACGLLALLLVGCSDDFDPPWLITGLRVLGVQSTVLEDNARSRPAPGETVRLELVTLAPNEGTRGAYSMFACLTLGTSFGGVAPCEGSLLAVAEDESRSADPVIDVPIPADALDTAPQFQMIGVLCERGSIAVDPQEVDPANLGDVQICSDPTDPGEIFFFRSDIDDSTATNLITTFDPDAVTIAGAPWGEPNGGPCMPDDGRPRVTAFEKVEIEIGGFSDDDREFFITTTRSDDIVQQESLILASFTTDGELERQFSAIENEGDTSTSFEWTAERDDIPAVGLVRFMFTLRDGRGGFDSVVRELCVNPV
ncbi:MAG: hypothetical protein AAF411_17670 [Myxococcota bacterium]